MISSFLSVVRRTWSPHADDEKLRLKRKGTKLRRDVKGDPRSSPGNEKGHWIQPARGSRSEESENGRLVTVIGIRSANNSLLSSGIPKSDSVATVEGPRLGKQSSPIDSETQEPLDFEIHAAGRGDLQGSSSSGKACRKVLDKSRKMG